MTVRTWPENEIRAAMDTCAVSKTRADHVINKLTSPEESWRWYIVVEEFGDSKEVFNSRLGAEEWAKEWGGNVIRVKSSTVGKQEATT